METMRASAQSGRTVEIEVVELDSVNVEILGPGSDNTVWTCPFKLAITIASTLTDNEGILDSSFVVTNFVCQREFDSCQQIIGNLKIVEYDPSYSFSNCTITVIFPTCKIVEICFVERILPVWISGVACVVNDFLARELSRNHIVEDSQAVSTHGVGMIVSEFADLLIFWAYAIICRWSNSMFLKIVPVSISIRTGSVIIDEIIVWVCDPEACGSLVSVKQTP
jgi:hypothetical protein